MPYIAQEDRKQYEEFLKHIPKEIPTKGDLEYLIFTLMLKYMEERPAKYSNLHDTVYAAMHCADEFRRRFLDMREDLARSTNGDIIVRTKTLV